MAAAESHSLEGIKILAESISNNNGLNCKMFFDI